MHVPSQLFIVRSQSGILVVAKTEDGSTGDRNETMMTHTGANHSLSAFALCTMRPDVAGDFSNP